MNCDRFSIVNRGEGRCSLSQQAEGFTVYSEWMRDRLTSDSHVHDELAG